MSSIIGLGEVRTFDGIPFVWVQIRDDLAGWIQQDMAPNPPTYTGFGPSDPYPQFRYSPSPMPTIPEPNTLALVLIGLGVIAVWRWGIAKAFTR